MTATSMYYAPLDVLRIVCFMSACYRRHRCRDISALKIAFNRQWFHTQFLSSLDKPRCIFNIIDAHLFDLLFSPPLFGHCTICKLSKSVPMLSRIADASDKSSRALIFFHCLFTPTTELVTIIRMRYNGLMIIGSGIDARRKRCDRRLLMMRHYYYISFYHAAIISISPSVPLRRALHGWRQ